MLRLGSYRLFHLKTEPRESDFVKRNSQVDGEEVTGHSSPVQEAWTCRSGNRKDEWGKTNEEFGEHQWSKRGNRQAEQRVLITLRADYEGNPHSLFPGTLTGDGSNSRKIPSC